MSGLYPLSSIVIQPTANANIIIEDITMSIDFPNSPSNGDTYSYDGKQWTFDGEKWETSGGSKGQKGEAGAGGGEKGDTGATGATGPTGGKGEKGETGTGAQGPAGLSGSDGAKGDKGESGGVGPQGNTGPTGADSTVAGPTGPQGPAGAKGEKGEASTVVGPQGAQGPAGSDGAKGEVGPQGVAGGTFVGASASPSAQLDTTATYQTVALNTVAYDTSSLVSSNAFVIPANSSISYVEINADLESIQRASYYPTGVRIQKNGSTILEDLLLTNNSGRNLRLNTGVIPATANDSFVVQARGGGNDGAVGTNSTISIHATVTGTTAQGDKGAKGDTGAGSSSQWTTTGSDIYYNGGNVAVGSTSSNYPLLVTSTPSHGVLTRFDGSGVANTNSVEIDIVGPQSNGQLNMGVGGDNINDGSNNVDDKAFIVATGLSGLNLRADSGYVQITADGVASSNEVARFSSSGVQFNQAYTFPTSDGNANEVLKTNGSGTLSFTDPKLTTFLYSTTSDLPSASTYHGAIAHVHAEGALYFAHGGSWNKLANDSSAVSSSTETTFTADVNFDTGVSEKFSTLTGATGVVTHDCDNGHIFYHTSISADFTANFTNLGLSTNYSTNLTLILNQGATAYIPSAVQIGGSAQTINWQGGSAPTGTVNGIDAVSFTVLEVSGTYVVLGQLVDFT